MKIELEETAPNFTVVSVNGVSIAFSYKTPIGYNKWNGEGWTVRENDWNTTTGKHLNSLNPDKRTRIPGVYFEEQLAALEV